MAISVLTFIDGFKKDAGSELYWNVYQYELDDAYCQIMFACLPPGKVGSYTTELPKFFHQHVYKEQLHLRRVSQLRAYDTVL